MNSIGTRPLASSMSSGRLKVFSNLANWINEYRTYRRDDKGRVIKNDDHLMDATRYLVMSGLARARAKPYDFWPTPSRAGHHTFDYDPMAEAYATRPTLQ